MVASVDRSRTLEARFWAELARHDVPVGWLEHFRLTNDMPDDAVLSDRDSDGIPAWQEFFAGSDPTDGSSFLSIVDIEDRDGSNGVVWLGGTNGSARPFIVQVSTNLEGGWSTLDAGVPRSPTGTNAWWTSSVWGRAFFRVLVGTGD
jgi:hypothetical protein